MVDGGRERPAAGNGGLGWRPAGPERDSRAAAALEVFTAFRPAVERVVSRVVALFLTAYAALHVTWIGEPGLDALDRSLLVVAGLLLLAVCLRCWLVRLDVIDVGVAVVAMMLSLPAEAAFPTDLVGSGAGPADALLTAAMLTGSIALRQRRFVTSMVVLIVGYAVGQYVVGGTAGLLTALDESLSDGATIAAFAYALERYRRSADRHDAAAFARLAVREESAARAAVEATAAERRRMIHDDVISSLVTVQHSRSQEASLAAASRGVSALDEFASPQAVATEGMADWLRADDIHLDVQVDVEEIDGEVAAPSYVIGAVTAAVREALRNVQRHAGVGRAHVIVSLGSTHVRVVVRDEGRGFSPQHAHGFGTRQSIVGRMTSVGGTAEIVSAPGAGTTVVLTWSDRAVVPERQKRLNAVRSATGDPLGFALVVTAAAALGQLWIFARHGGSGAHPAAAIVLGVATATATAVVAVAAARRPLRWWSQLGIGVLWSGMLGAGLALAHPGALLSYESWMLELSCVVLVPLAFFVSFRSLIALALALAVVILVTAGRDPTLELADGIGAALHPLLLAGGLGLIARGLRRAGERAAEAEDELNREIVARAYAESRTAAVRELELGIRQEVKGFLTSVIEGAADWGSDDVHRRAGLLALRTRDELFLPGVLGEELHQLLAVARESGATVTVRPSDLPPPRAVTARLLRAALDPASLQQATLTLPDASSRTMRLVLLPAFDPQQHAWVAQELADLGPTIDTYDGSTTVTIAVP